MVIDSLQNCENIRIMKKMSENSLFDYTPNKDIIFILWTIFI
jgi:hypothetical protein